MSVFLFDGGAGGDSPWSVEVLIFANDDGPDLYRNGPVVIPPGRTYPWYSVFFIKDDRR